jgi:hypothetical protein
LLPFAEPKPASARGPFSSRMRAARRSRAPSPLPGRLAEHRERIRGIDGAVRILRHAVATDQRLGEPLRMRNVVEAEAALDAQPLVVRRPVAPLDAHDVVAADVVGDLAADAAVRDTPTTLSCRPREVGFVRGGERAGRAGLHALAARHARREAHRVVEVEHDRRVRAAMGVSDHVVDLRLAARAHAARALDARVEVDRHRRVRQVGDRLLAHREARRPDAELALPGRELGVGLVDALRHVGREQLDDHLLRGDRARAVGRNLHAGRGRAAARRREHALALDLDHARAAVAVGPQPRLVAEPRDLDAQAIRDLEDRLAGHGGDVVAVQLERDRRLLEHGFVRSVHDRKSTLRARGEST